MSWPLLAPLPQRDADPVGARVELRCAECGYGIVVNDPAPPCPMCRTSRWEPVGREPLADHDGRSLDAVDDELAARRLRPRQKRR